MTKRDRLRAEGIAAAKLRGHRLGRFVHDERGAVAECRDCGFTVAVLPNPRPNEAELMGRALAEDCNPDGCEWQCDRCRVRLWREFERDGHRALTGHREYTRVHGRPYRGGETDDSRRQAASGVGCSPGGGM